MGVPQWTNSDFGHLCLGGAGDWHDSVTARPQLEAGRQAAGSVPAPHQSDDFI